MNDKFVRDPYSGAVLNTDNEALAAYKKRKNREREVEQLKQDVSEMKTLLEEILKRLK